MAQRPSSSSDSLGLSPEEPPRTSVLGSTASALVVDGTASTYPSAKAMQRSSNEGSEAKTEGAEHFSGRPEECLRKLNESSEARTEGAEHFSGRLEECVRKLINKPEILNMVEESVMEIVLGSEAR